jgi:multidrug resistance efflux pump
MRFQNSGLRPYDRDCAVLPPVKIHPKRRLWWIRPRTILFVVLAAIALAFVLDRTWVRGNGIVAGELVAVSPIVQARLQHLFVHCLDRVKAGQRLVEFDNEATVEFAAQQLLALQLQLTLAQQGIEVATQQMGAAKKLVEAQDALWKQQIAIMDAETQLLTHHYVAELVWEQAKSAVVRADAETMAAEFVYETKKADLKKSELDVKMLEDRIASFKDSPELTGHFFLTAAKDGIITGCTAREGEVIAARTPIFSIFNPDDTYAVVFFDPNDIGKVARGQSYTIHVQGIDKSITGTVTDFYPELSALPSSLTRYFWQREMWSQYIPVRLDFTNLEATDRNKVFAWAQLSASRFDDFGASGVTNAASATWRWVHRRISGAWQVITASSAQQSTDR